MSNIHANQPHIHLQHHAITHSADQYSVTPTSDDSELKINHAHRQKKHLHLKSLIIIFALGVSILLALELMPSWIKTRFAINNQNVSSVAPTTLASELDKRSSMLLIQTTDGLAALSPDDKKVEQLNSLAAVKSISSDMRIVRHPTDAVWLLYSIKRNGKTSVITSEAEIDINNQALASYDNVQVVDSLWHPNSPQIYVLFTTERLNLLETHLLQLNYESNQSRISPVSTGSEPVLAWVQPSDSRVFIHSQLPENQTQLTTVSPNGDTKSVTLPEQLIGKANSLGSIPVLRDSIVHLTSIFAVAVNNPIVIYTATPTTLQSVWETQTGRLALLSTSESSMQVMAFNAAGSAVCSETMPATIQPVHIIDGSGWLVLESQQIGVISAESCQTSALHDLSETSIVTYHGRL